MNQYHWKFVLVRDLFAFVAALVWSVRSYAGTIFRPGICNPTWAGFLSFVALVIATLAVIEFFAWAIWLLRTMSQRSYMSPVAGDRTFLVLVNTRNIKGSLLKFVAGLLLVLLSIFVGGPSPCGPLHREPWSWPFFLGCLICGLGFLTIADGCVREE